jgi:hypothetical protein
MGGVRVSDCNSKSTLSVLLRHAVWSLRGTVWTGSMASKDALQRAALISSKIVVFFVRPRRSPINVTKPGSSGFSVARVSDSPPLPSCWKVSKIHFLQDPGLDTTVHDLTETSMLSQSLEPQQQLAEAATNVLTNAD